MPARVAFRVMQKFVAILFLALLACAPTQQPANQKSMNEPGMIYIAGTVLSGPDQTPQKNWGVYVRDGVIRDVGPAADLQKAHPRVNVRAMLNATMLPGLTDAHGHLYGLGLSLDVVKLVDTKSYDEVIARVKERRSEEHTSELQSHA